jgi:hypothetical protein
MEGEDFRRTDDAPGCGVEVGINSTGM